MLAVKIFFLAFAAFYAVPQLVAAVVMFRVLMVRTTAKKWSRGRCSAPKNREHAKMWEDGMAWRRENIGAMAEVNVENDGLVLRGEYFDFGFDKAAIIISGRAETCNYSVYFADAYKNARFNVLAIDNRGIGRSDGKYLCAGLKESGDVIAWSRLLKNDFGVRKIVLHGICIGAATAIFAAAKEKIFSALVVEGVFSSFLELFKRQITERRQIPFPSLQIFAFLVKIFAKVDLRKSVPEKAIANVDCPVLFLHSKADRFARPECAEKVFSACASRKRIEWFENAVHSHVKIRHKERYDAAIARFLSECED